MPNGWPGWPEGRPPLKSEPDPFLPWVSLMPYLDLIGTKPDSDAGLLLQMGPVEWASLMQYLCCWQSSALQSARPNDEWGIDAEGCQLLAEALGHAMLAGEPERFYEEVPSPTWGLSWANWSTPEARRERVVVVARFAEFLKHCGGYTTFADSWDFW